MNFSKAKKTLDDNRDLAKKRGDAIDVGNDKAAELNEVSDNFLGNIKKYNERMEERERLKSARVKRIEEKFDKFVNKTGKNITSGAKKIGSTTKN